MRCHICGNDKYNPHKRIVDSRVAEMCVAKIHDGTYPVPTGAASFLAVAVKSFRKIGMKRQ